MKIFKKAVMLFAVVLMLAVATPAAFAASDVTVEAGKTATVTFDFKDVFNVDGAFKVSDANGIVTGYTIKVANAGATSAVVSGDRLWAAPSGEPVKTNVSVAVNVNISDKATAGKICTVSFSGVYGNGNEKPGNEHDVNQSATVTVKATTPVTPPVEPKVDYSELNKQIGNAEALKSTGYTDASWKNVTDALKAAKAALKSTSQTTVDSAAKALKDAIAALVKMDYSKLSTALETVESFVASEDLTDLWKQLTDAVSEGKALLTSGDQAAVDAAATKINGILDQIKKLIEELKTPEIVEKVVEKEVIKEVEVEKFVDVEPTDDFCNISLHSVWPILFFVSLALNVVLAIVVVKKKKNG